MAKILIVDDSRTSRKLMKELLTNGGHEVVGEAKDGEEGFLLFKELKPDLVTMDITMPKMDGIESLSLIKKSDENAKVLMITAAGQQEKMILALKRGAADFITKPFDQDKVLKAIEEALK